MITRDIDNLSHRATHTGMQYDMYQEELVRRHFGHVDQVIYSIRPPENLDTTQCIEVITDIMKAAGAQWMPKTFKYGRLEGSLAIAEDWFLHVGLESIWDDDSPESGRVNSLSLDGYTADLPAVERVMATLVESGFRQGTASEEETAIEFVYPQSGDAFNPVGTATQYIRRLRFEDCRVNYIPDVAAQVDLLLEQTLPNADHGIVIIHGPTGTGKRTCCGRFYRRRAGVRCSAHPPRSFSHSHHCCTKPYSPTLDRL